MKSFRNLIGEDILQAFIQESSAFEFGIPPEHGGVRNALDNAKRLLGEYGLDGKIVAGGEIPVLRVFGDPQKVLEWAGQVGPDTYAEDYSVEDLEKEHAVGMKREMGERYVLDEVLMVRTQKTKDGKSYEWLVQKVEHNNTETIEKGTESSRAKAMAAGKKAKKGLSEAVAADQIGKILKKYRADFAKFKKGGKSLGDPGMEEFYNALFDYFVGSGEMPYGTAKARTGDPLEWIEDRLMDEGTKREEIIKEAKTMGGILKKVKKGTPPYTVVAMVKGKVVDQQVARVASQVPAIIKEFQGGGSGATDLGSKHGGEVKIAVEDKDSRVVYSEQTENNWNNEETINEELAYLQSKDGKKTFVVGPRDTRGMRGKQDKFLMYIVDAKTGKKIEDLGSHVSLKGAIKYALNRGFVKKQKGSTSEIKYNSSHSDLQKSFRYDTLTGKRNESSGGGGHPRKALNFDERQKAYASAYQRVNKKAPSRDELRAAGVGKGFEKSFGDTSKGVKAWKAAMEKLKKQDKRKQFNWRQEYQYN